MRKQVKISHTSYYSWLITDSRMMYEITMNVLPREDCDLFFTVVKVFILLLPSVFDVIDLLVL